VPDEGEGFCCTKRGLQKKTLLVVLVSHARNMSAASTSSEALSTSVDWLFTPAELLSTPSISSGELSESKEREYRKIGSAFIQEVGQRLGIP
jgi:Cyclin, N-terminal domain